MNVAESSSRGLITVVTKFVVGIVGVFLWLGFFPA
jgi:hypothetical protein